MPSQLVERFAEHQRRQHYATSGQLRIGLVLPRFLAHLRTKRVRDVRQVDEEHLLSFLREIGTKKSARTGAPLARWSCAAYLSTVRCFFAFLEEQRVILRNPARYVPLPKATRLPRQLMSERDVERMINAAAPFTARGKKDAAILETLYGTGVRLGECQRLDVNDVDLHRRVLVIRKGKGRADRVVPLVGRVALALERYLREGRPLLIAANREAALFVSGTFGRRYSQIGLQVLVRMYGERARLPYRVSTHMLRHAFARHLLRGGADVRHVQALLGHQDIGTTQLYTTVTLGDLKTAISRAHPRPKKT